MAKLKFDIPPRAKLCSKGEESFLPGMDYYSLLEEQSSEGFIRKDFCVECWNALYGKSEPSGIGKAFWKSNIPQKKKESLKNLKRDERALLLLRSLHGSEVREEISQAFVLALLLLRSKVLVKRQELIKESGQVILVYEMAESGEVFMIEKCDISTINVSQIQNLIAAKLNESSSEDISVDIEVECTSG